MDVKERWESVEKMMEEKTGQLITLPLIDSFIVKNNFKGLLIMLSRYKFIAKMLEGRKNVVEVGCNAGFRTTILAQFVENVYGIDYDAEQIKFAKENFENVLGKGRTKFLCEDIFNIKGPVNGIENDGIFAIDVIEHIPVEKEDLFIEQMIKSIHKDGVCIIGTPNITTAPYQSETSKAAHINLYSHDRLKTLMDRHFKNTFLFCMNDEVVHTGFPQMAHYLIVMGVTPKK